MRFKTGLLGAVVPALMAILVTLLLAPTPAPVGYRSAGDAVLVNRVRALVAGPEARASGSDQGFRSLAVGVVDGATSSYAFIGDRGYGSPPDASSTFELASVTKTFTALMLADSVTRGEVRLSDRVGRYLPELQGTRAGSVTLEELATHRSGLPAYSDLVAGATYEGFGSADLQSEDEAVILQQTRGLRLSGRGQWQYSHLGVSLLGFALARATGEPSWESLVRHRVLEPYGMTSTTFARTDAQIPASAAQGHHINGSPVEPVTGGGYLPAGTTTFTTVTDMTRYASALLSGRAIGLWSLTPRYEINEDESIGLVWMTRTVAGHDVHFHPGGVPGYSSFFVVDPTAGRAVVVLGGSEESVEAIGFHLLDASSTVPWFVRPSTQSALGVTGLVLVAGAMLAGLRGRQPVVLAAAGALAQTGLILLLRDGPWHRIPGWTWGLAAFAVFWITVDVGRSWGAPTRRPHSRRLAWVGLGLAVAAYAAVIVTTPR